MWSNGVTKGEGRYGKYEHQRPQATPKGLRHSFGVTSIKNNVPVAMAQRWLGHSRIDTTLIYQQAVGAEERAFATRLWRQWEKQASAIDANGADRC